jgi:hypothetical protein
MHSLDAVRLLQTEPLTSVTHLSVTASRPPGGVMLRSAFPSIEILRLAISARRVSTAYLQMVAEVLPRLRKVKVAADSYVRPFNTPHGVHRGAGQRVAAEEGGIRGGRAVGGAGAGARAGPQTFLLRRNVDEDLRQYVRMQVIHSSTNTELSVHVRTSRCGQHFPCILAEVASQPRDRSQPIPYCLYCCSEAEPG